MISESNMIGNRNSLGRHLTEEHKQILRDYHLGKKLSLKTKLKIGKANKGKPAWNKGLTIESDKRVKDYSQKLRGRIQSKEHRIKNSNVHKGQIPWHKGRVNVYSEKALKNISEGTKKAMTEEVRDKLRQSHIGKVIAHEQKKKISATMQGIPFEEWNGFTSSGLYDINFNNKFRQLIRKRDNQICMNCNVHREQIKESLSVHHINYDKNCTIEQNCISLCRRCHTFTNLNRPYWIKLFQEKLSKLYGYKYNTEGVIQLNLLKTQ